MKTTTHNLGDQHIRLEKFNAHGMPCIKEVIIMRPNSDDPKERVYFYVDTGKLPMLTSTHRDKLKRTCASMDELERMINATHDYSSRVGGRGKNGKFTSEATRP